MGAQPTMFPLAPDLLSARRSAAAGPLAPLADALASGLTPLLASPIYLPTQKALLSRVGGRCPHDGTTLEFDPYSPHQHRCSSCGAVQDGDLHDRWWVYPYQLWLAERCVQAALLFLLRGDQRHGRLAGDILRRYAGAYASYPNSDNVLGPTRLFFSTYLESIWLLQICAATAFLEAAGDNSVSREVRGKIVEPSAALIAQYDEGLSNRQTWNNAALMAACLVLGDRSGAERIVRAPSGLETHLREGLLGDGTWYEGENYHLFAHRALWYGVTMCESADIALDPALVARFQEGFAAPIASALPDLTLPSRKDSQYAISLRQPRFAESCELGIARSDDRRLAGALQQLYAADIPRVDPGTARSTADVERNVPATALTRADLGWRALLSARTELPAAAALSPGSALLRGQGLAVFRRDQGRVYVALDYGQSGGGHGHPDRLNVTASLGATRWLDDLGTGSYVDPSLHWYRSTLAHNAPLVDGQSQARVAGTLLAHDERGGVGWVLARVDGIAPDVRVERAIVVTPDYFIDELRWVAPNHLRLDLPMHFAADLHGSDLVNEAVLDGGHGEEDGFGFVSDARSAAFRALESVTLTAASARAFVAASTPWQLFRASAPGQPSTQQRVFYVVRCAAADGAIRSVWAWSPRVTSVAFDGERIEVTLGDERHVHQRTTEHWQMELSAANAASGIELTGWQPAEHPTRPPAVPRRSPAPIALPRGQEVVFDLAEPHYRRSDDSWTIAGRPHATVKVVATGSELAVSISVHNVAPTFVLANAVNPYDNEHADVNGHGVQLYVRTPRDGGAWVVVPEIKARTARVRPLTGWGALGVTRTHWERSPDGYRLEVHVELPADAAQFEYPIALDVLINETTPDRERRRGQLVLSGADGEFVYLQGDRHDPGRLVPLLITG